MISIIVCCYNEEKIIEKSWKRLREVLRCFPEKFEIIFINDGSTDSTGKILHSISLKEKKVTYYGYQPNKGYGNALCEGLILTHGDFIITLDADLAMDPKAVINSCVYWSNKGYDMIICSRYKGIKPNYPLLRRIASEGYKLLNKRLLGIPVEDTQSGFIGFKKSILNNIKLKSKDFSILMELIIKAHRNNVKILEIPIQFIHSTISGETSILRAGPKMFLNSLKIWRELLKL